MLRSVSRKMAMHCRKFQLPRGRYTRDGVTTSYIKAGFGSTSWSETCRNNTAGCLTYGVYLAHSTKVEEKGPFASSIRKTKFSSICESVGECESCLWACWKVCRPLRPPC